MSNLNELTVIIVTFKTKDEILFNCINSIKKEIKIINVENSNDASHKNKIEKKYENVEVILSGKNLGYCSANNLGLQNVKTRYVLISNPDVEYNKDFFDQLEFYLKGDIEFSVTGPSYNDETNFLPHGNLDGTINKDKFNNFFLKEVGYVVGCAMLLDRNNINTNFDENFFLYFEEADFCKRISLNGGKIFTCSKLFITHLGYKGSISTDPRYEIESEVIRSWHWMWSTFYYHKKYYGFFIALLMVSRKFLSALIKVIFYSILFDQNKKKIYYQRLSGLFNSIMGKKSWYRPKVS